MRRSSLLLTFFFGLGLILAACAGQTGLPGEPTEEASSTPTPEAGSPVGGDDGGEGGEGGGSTGEAPALADGPWTGGQGQVTVSGGVEGAWDEPITTDVSHTTDAKTQLAYNSDDTFVTIGFNFIGVPFHVSVTSPDFTVSGEEDCEVTYNRADDTGIDATFSCVAYEVMVYGSGPSTERTMIEGSFTATR